MIKKRLNKILESIEELSAIAPKTDMGRPMGTAPSIFISNIRNNHSVRQLTLLARNSETAVSMILDQLVVWSELEEDNEELNFDLSISAVLIALIDAGRIEAEIMSSSIAEDEDHHHAAIIARTFLLQKRFDDSFKELGKNKEND